MRIYYSLYDRLLDRRALARAFEKVRRGKGAPGVDGQTIADFESGLEEDRVRVSCRFSRRIRMHPPLMRASRSAFFRFAPTHSTTANATGRGDGFRVHAKFTWKSPGFVQTDDHPVVDVSWRRLIRKNSFVKHSFFSILDAMTPSVHNCSILPCLALQRSLKTGLSTRTGHLIPEQVRKQRNWPKLDIPTRKHLETTGLVRPPNASRQHCHNMAADFR